jgi:hypothetical protein
VYSTESTLAAAITPRRKTFLYYPLNDSNERTGPPTSFKEKCLSVIPINLFSEENMKTFSRFVLTLALFVLYTHAATAQTDRTNTTGSNDASITTRTQSGTQQATPSPTPFTPGVQLPASPSSTPISQRPLTPEERQRQAQASERRRQEAATGDPDVLLDVPNLSVDEIGLEVDNLKARVSLDARLANLLSLNAGADVGIDKVRLTIRGVRAEVLLKVRLDNVAKIIDRTLTTIDKNPQVFERIIQGVENTVGAVGNVANTAVGPGGAVTQTLNNATQPGGLLSQTVNQLGQTVQRTVDSTGNIVERTLDNTGSVLNQRTLGSLTNLGGTVLNETTNAAGQTVRRVRDTSGAVIELTLDQAGKVVNSRVISQASGTQRR